MSRTEDYSSYTTQELISVAKSNQLERTDKDALLFVLANRLEELFKQLGKF